MVWGVVTGRQGEVVENENSKRLLQFYAKNELVLTNTWLQHKDNHKFTWEYRGKISGELIVSRYVAESITTDAGRFGHVGLCQLRTNEFCTCCISCY